MKVRARVGPKGQVVIPKELRDEFKLSPGDEVMFDADERTILIYPPMMYCDSNLFVYPAIYAGEKAAAAVKILEALAEGKLQGVTCSLTIDEVLWIVWKNVGKVEAIEQAKHVLEFPNLKVVDTRALDMRKAMDLIKKYDLKPRDAIHAACSLNHAIFR